MGACSSKQSTDVRGPPVAATIPTPTMVSGHSNGAMPSTPRPVSRSSSARATTITRSRSHSSNERKRDGTFVSTSPLPTTHITAQRLSKPSLGPITQPLPFTRLASSRVRCDQLSTTIAIAMPGWHDGWARDLLPLIVDYAVGHRLFITGISSYHGNNVAYSICPTTALIAWHPSNGNNTVSGRVSPTSNGGEFDWRAYATMDSAIYHGVLLNTGDSMFRCVRSDTDQRSGTCITWTYEDMESVAALPDARAAHLIWLIAQRDRTPSIWKTTRMSKQFPWMHGNSASVVMPDGRWMMIGARSIDGELLPVCECYDATWNTWHTLAPMIEARSHPATSVFDGKVWCFGGGYNNEWQQPLRRAMVYNPTTNKWSAIAEMIHKRHGAAAIGIDGMGIIIAGGRTGDGVDEHVEVELSMELYVPSSNTYTLLPWQLPPLDESTTRLDREELTLLHIIDGWLVCQRQEHNATRWFALELAATNPYWRSLPDLPTKLNGTISCVY
jgi:hypothetical protein